MRKVDEQTILTEEMSLLEEYWEYRKREEKKRRDKKRREARIKTIIENPNNSTAVIWAHAMAKPGECSNHADGRQQETDSQRCVGYAQPTLT